MMPTVFNQTFVTIAYGIAFVLALYLTLVWRAFRARRVWRAGSTMQITRVSAYQMALMAGGASRVALTAVVRLLARKALVAGIAGVLVPSDEFVGEYDPVEREVVATARKAAVFKDFMVHVEIRLKRVGVTGQLRGELIAAGYMRGRGSKAWWANYARNMLPFAMLIAAELYGFASVAMTADAKHWLIGFAICSAGAMLLVALPTRVTALGRYIVWSATQHHPDLKTARAVQKDALDIKTLGQSVALYGPDALAGSDMAWIPAVLAQVDHSD